MKKQRKNKDLTVGKIISAILFIALMATLILFAANYDPSKQYSNSFFEDVAKVMKQ